MSAQCRQPEGLDELPHPYYVDHHPHPQEVHPLDMHPPDMQQAHPLDMQQDHYSGSMYGSMVLKHQGIEEGAECQSLSARQAVAQFAASQEYSYEGHLAPTGMQSLEPPCNLEARLQQEEEAGMWVEDGYLEHHSGMKPPVISTCSEYIINLFNTNRFASSSLHTRVPGAAAESADVPSMCVGLCAVVRHVASLVHLSCLHTYSCD